MGIYDRRVCHCGSGKPSQWQLDGNGIPLCRTCKECHERKMSGYRSEVLVPYGQDVVDEPIEPEDYWSSLDVTPLQSSKTICWLLELIVNHQ